MLRSVAEFPVSKDLTGVRSWHGLVNQVGGFHADHTIMDSLRLMTEWTDEHSKAFMDSRRKILKAVEDDIRTFSVKRETCLATDWSRTGMGFRLL